MGSVLEQGWPHFLGAPHVTAPASSSPATPTAAPTPHGCRQAIQDGKERNGRHLEDAARRRARIPARETSGADVRGLWWEKAR